MSRLNQNLRETHGYAYGAGSSFAYRPVAGPFLASADVQTDVTSKDMAIALGTELGQQIRIEAGDRIIWDE